MPKLMPQTYLSVSYLISSKRLLFKNIAHDGCTWLYLTVPGCTWLNPGLPQVYLTTDCHILPLTSLNASVYTALNAGMGWGENLCKHLQVLRAPLCCANLQVVFAFATHFSLRADIYASDLYSICFYFLFILSDVSRDELVPVLQKMSTAAKLPKLQCI